MKELDVTNYDMRMVEDYIEDLQSDILKYADINLVSVDYIKLFQAAFIYLYAKGMEITYYDRIG